MLLIARKIKNITNLKLLSYEKSTRIIRGFYIL